MGSHQQHSAEVKGAHDGLRRVGIETDRGPWVQGLIAAGYQVWAINPVEAARHVKVAWAYQTMI